MRLIKVNREDICKHYRLENSGKEPSSHSCIFDYCRKLVQEGISPKTMLEIYNRDGELSIEVNEIGKGALLDVFENEEKGPRFRKYRPFHPF